MKHPEGFAIIAVYVDDLNLIGSKATLAEAAEYLKTEFEMKDIGQTKFCFGLQIEHLPEGILVHQRTYTARILQRFKMADCHPLSSPMVVRILDPERDQFRPAGKDEQILGKNVPYLEAIGALMYLACCTRPDISFAVNLLARYSSAQVMQTPVIYPIRTKQDRRLDMYLHAEEQPYHGNLLNRRWLRLRRIMLNSSHCTKQAEKVFGYAPL